MICGVRGEIHLSRAAVAWVTIMSKSTSWHLVCHQIVLRDDSCSTQIVNRDRQLRCLWHVGNAGWHCPALSYCCRFFQLAACGWRTSLGSSIAGLSRKEFDPMDLKGLKIVTRAEHQLQRRETAA
jgi:hypothetical protein